MNGGRRHGRRTCRAGGATAAQADDHEIVVGFAVSTSGWQAAYTGPATLAAQIRLEEINALAACSANSS